MNPRQQAAMTALQNALLNQLNITTPLPNLGTRVGICVHGSAGRHGVYRTGWRVYSTGGPFVSTKLATNVDARVEFQKNRPGPHQSGHELGIVGIDWRCDGQNCGYENETPDELFRRSVFIGRRS